MGLQIALGRMPRPAMPPDYATGRKVDAIVSASVEGVCGKLNDDVVSLAVRARSRFARRREDQVTMAVLVRTASQLEAQEKGWSKSRPSGPRSWASAPQWKSCWGN